MNRNKQKGFGDPITLILVATVAMFGLRYAYEADKDRDRIEQKQRSTPIEYQIDREESGRLVRND